MTTYKQEVGPSLGSEAVGILFLAFPASRSLQKVRQTFLLFINYVVYGILLQTGQDKLLWRQTLRSPHMQKYLCQVRELTKMAFVLVCKWCCNTQPQAGCLKPQKFTGS